MWLTILDQRDGTVNRDIPERAARYSKRMLEEMIDEEAAAACGRRPDPHRRREGRKKATSKGLW